MKLVLIVVDEKFVLKCVLHYTTRKCILVKFMEECLSVLSSAQHVLEPNVKAKMGIVI